jgi:putative transposase
VTPTAKAINLDVGLNHFYTDSTAATVPNHRCYIRKIDKALKQLQKRVSREKKVRVIAKKL